MNEIEAKGDASSDGVKQDVNPAAVPETSGKKDAGIPSAAATESVPVREPSAVPEAGTAVSAAANTASRAASDGVSVPQKPQAVPGMNGTPQAGIPCGRQFCSRIMAVHFPNGIAGTPYRHEIMLNSLMPDDPESEIKDAGLSSRDMGLTVVCENGKIVLSGVPKEKGSLLVWLECRVRGAIILREEFPPITIFPNPKTLWKNLPPDASAPYQVPNEKSCSRFDISGRGIVAASKRGRSHAHDGRFRDDDFSFDWLPETGWLIVAVSDGAGSAEFSREGARVACATFVDELTVKLSSSETNRKLEAIPEKRGQEQALERLLLGTAHQAAENIQEVAKAKWYPAKKFSATFLGYIARKMKDEWLIVSVGIGDGAIGLVDSEGNLFLLNEPDGGEYVGQTRFLTTPEVWQDSHRRTFSVRVPDFKYLCSMTDGVSDPKFETDNNLKDPGKWKALWDDLCHSSDAPIHFERRDKTLEAELLAWLDFWSRGNHDDRTLTILY